MKSFRLVISLVAVSACLAPRWPGYPKGSRERGEHGTVGKVQCMWRVFQLSWSLAAAGLPREAALLADSMQIDE
jgi:hypothetical protein